MSSIAELDRSSILLPATNRESFPHFQQSTSGRRMAMANYDSTAEYKCKLCFMEFASITAVLQHELSHMMGVNAGNGIQTGTKRRKVGGKPYFRKKNRRTAKVTQVEVDEILAELEDEVRGQLLSCEDGSELNVLCRIFQPDPNYLAQAYNSILNDLYAVLGAEGVWNIQAFGSTVTGMAFKDSDIDFYITPDMIDQPFTKAFNRINSLLHRSSLFGKCLAVRGARVPVIKCIHEPTGIKIDINMSSSFGVQNSHFISKVFQYDQRIHPFMLIIKIWAKCWCITKTARMTNYTLILLVVFYLQTCENPILPPLKDFRQNTPALLVDGINFAFNENLRSRTKNRNNIRSMLRQFFEFYADFDFASNIICPFLGKTFNRLDFSAGTIPFPEYTKQMEMMRKREIELKQMGAQDWNRDIRSTPLDYMSLMVVEDIFCLNNNTAKTVSLQTHEAFKRQVAHAARICQEQNASPGQLLVRLFYEQPAVVDIPPQPPRIAPTPASTGQQNKQTGVHTCRLAPIETELFFVRLHLRKLDVNKTYEKCDIDKTWTECSIQFIKQTLTDLYKMKITPRNNLGPNDKFHMNAELEAFHETWKLRKFDTKKGYAIFLQEQANFADLLVQSPTSTERLIRCRLNIDADVENFTGIVITMQLMPPALKNHLATFFKDLTSRIRLFLKAYFEKFALETNESVE